VCDVALNIQILTRISFFGYKDISCSTGCITTDLRRVISNIVVDFTQIKIFFKRRPGYLGDNTSYFCGKFQILNSAGVLNLLNESFLCSSLHFPPPQTNHVKVF